MHRKLIFCFPASSTCVNFFQDLILELSKESEIHIISGKDYAFEELINFSKKNGFNMVNINFPRKISLGLFNTYRKISLAIKKIDSSSSKAIVFSNTPIMSFMVSIFRLFNSRIKHIHFCHGLFSYNQRFLKHQVFKICEQITFNLSDGIIFVSESLKEYAKNNYVLSQHKIKNISSITGVDIAPSTQFNDFQFRLGFFGRVCFDKGFEDFYELYKMLPEHFTFVIAGPLDDKKYKKLLDSSDIRFKYLGVVNDRAEFFNNIDLLIFPSRREGFGVAIIESSSYGVPTIAYDIVGVRDSLHSGSNGFKVLDITTAAVTVQALSKDADRYKQLQKNSIAFVKNNFKKKEVLHRNLKIINELI